MKVMGNLQVYFQNGMRCKVIKVIMVLVQDLNYQHLPRTGYCCGYHYLVVIEINLINSIGLEYGMFVCSESWDI